MATLFALAGSPPSVSGANGGKTYAANNIINTGNTQIAPANPFRQSITFHNPGTVNLFVSMVAQLSQAGVQSVLAPSNAAPGGAFVVLPGATLTLVGGEIQLAWQAFAASGTTNPITVMDSNA
jgi:hypothetical protein